MFVSVFSLSDKNIDALLFLYQKKWGASLIFNAESFSSSTHETYLRLKSDPDATKPYAALFKSNSLSDLQASLDVAKRKFPEKTRDNFAYFGVCHLKSENNSRLAYKTPSWMTLLVESSTGSTGTISKPNKEPVLGWDIIETPNTAETKEWIRAHILLFKNTHLHQNLGIERKGLKNKIYHHRISDLILRSAEPPLAKAYNLCLV